MERKTIELSISIAAPKAKVWSVLLEDETYREWTSVFHPGSYAETDWKEGSSARFLGPEGMGMVSRIDVHRPEEIITLEHLGIVKDGVEDYESDEVKSWSGLTETYRVREVGDTTHLEIEQIIGAEHFDWFQSMWEKALVKVKELAESGR